MQRGEITWKHLLSRRNNRHPDSKRDRYYVAEGALSHVSRIPTPLDSQYAESGARRGDAPRRLKRTLEGLRKIQSKLNTYRLKSRQQIAQRVESLRKQEHCETLITYELHATRAYQRLYRKKGRPGQDTPYKLVWKQVYSLSFAVDADAVNTEQATDGVFPLITNLNPQTHPAKKVLEVYKFQPFLETRHTQPKTYQEIAPVYLKNPQRMVASLHVHVMP